MLMVISPAKTLDFQRPLATQRYTQPELLPQSAALIDLCRQLTPARIGTLMGVSDKLADLNAARFQAWQTPFTPDNARQAILAFQGDVYTGLAAETFSEAQFDFAQRHLRMLSGLYGVLRPLDLMQPYRLEMGTRLANPDVASLYHFCGATLTDKLNQALAEQGDALVINLASDEYFRAVQPARINGRVIKPVFLDEKNGQYKVISFNAKKARGMMSRFIITEALTQPEQIKAFDAGGYRFDAAASSDNEWVLKRPQHDG